MCALVSLGSCHPGVLAFVVLLVALAFLLLAWGGLEVFKAYLEVKADMGRDRTPGGRSYRGDGAL